MRCYRATGVQCPLVSARESANAFAVEKKSLRRLRAAAEKLKAIPHLDEAERLLFARGLLATPDERWMFNRRYIQLVNSCKPSTRKKSAS